MKRFIFYLLRWQLSTPILWLVVRHLGVGIWSTVIANLIGGVIFFWVDKFILLLRLSRSGTSKTAAIAIDAGKRRPCGVLSKRKIMTARPLPQSSFALNVRQKNFRNCAPKVLKQTGNPNRNGAH